MNRERLTTDELSQKGTLSELTGSNDHDEFSQVTERILTARTEPFDSYWQAPDDIEKGYGSFFEYYRYNFLPHLTGLEHSRILVVSCGPGYLVKALIENGFSDVLGIDSDPEKVRYAQLKDLNCRVAQAFSYLQAKPAAFDAIVCEQELNHLTIDEMLEFLGICRMSLRPGGRLVVYGLNGANPLVGAENLAHNIDHFNMFTEYSLTQVLKISNFEDIRVFPLKLYVFWKNPMNYAGLLFTEFLHIVFRICFKLYGKRVRVLSKKLMATCRRPKE